MSDPWITPAYPLPKYRHAELSTAFPDLTPSKAAIYTADKPLFVCNKTGLSTETPRIHPYYRFLLKPNKGGYFKVDVNGNRRAITARQARSIFNNLGDAYKVDVNVGRCPKGSPNGTGGQVRAGAMKFSSWKKRK